MTLIRNILATLTLLLLVLNQVDAECCVMSQPVGSSHPGANLRPSPALITGLLYGGDSCRDGTRGTPCCGVGGCNVFCCNCDGGCRKAPVDRWPHYTDGEGGVKWLFNCDFPGYDIGHKTTAGEECGRLCIENSGCNAFSHHHGNCYLKNIPQTLGRSPADGGVCGFLPWKF